MVRYLLMWGQLEGRKLPFHHMSEILLFLIEGGRVVFRIGAIVCGDLGVEGKTCKLTGFKMKSYLF